MRIQDMNLPRYKFAKETEPELLEFLRVARNNKLSHKNCDLQKHEVWSKLFPLDPTLLEKLEKPNEDNRIIEISSDEESVEKEAEEIIENNLEEHLEAKNNLIINDLACAIKENLETLNDLSENAKKSVMNCSDNEQEELFILLSQNLNSEEIFYLGESLQRLTSTELIAIFCKSLLIPKLQKEYCDHLSTLTGSLYNSKYSSNLNKELLTALVEINENNNTKIFLQYLSNIDPNKQFSLLRDFIFSIDNLNKQHLSAVETLLNSQVEYEVLNKLIEMLSNIAEDYATDKAFGKLLVNIIQHLGTNVLLLEQSLKHIISGHKSVWKAKLQKTFDTHYEDTLMFTQSFRE